MKKLLFIAILFLVSTAIHAQTFTSSNLPIVIISTDYYPNTTIHQDIPDDPKIGADMKIIYHPDGSRNYVSDQNNPLLLNYTGRIKIEVRGSTSQWLSKKPYSLSTIKADNISNNNVSILGMPKDNDWKLNSFAWDPTFSRDYLAYALSNNIGNYACRGQYCEVIINDEYVGLYLFSESIKIGTDRVNITELTTADNTSPALTGGYITKCDKPTGGDMSAWSVLNHASQYVDFMHENPKPSLITNNQDQYIHSQFTNLQTAATNNNSSVSNGFPSIIDMPSFIDFMIINELMANVDAYQFSTFFHKDRNGKLRAGPVWDFNLSCGIDMFGNRSTTYDFQFDNGDNVGANFWKDLYYNPTFHCYFVKRWQELNATNNALSFAKISHIIDSVSTVLSEAKLRDDAKWSSVGSPDNNVSDLKDWLSNRITWMNANITSSGCSYPALQPLVITKIHYNPLPSAPYTSNQLEFVELTNNSNAPIDVSGYYFRKLGLTYTFPNNSIIPANGKIYLTSNTAAFTAFYNYTPFGEYSRNLSNTSEELILSDAYGSVVDYVKYESTAPWPTAANGVGAHLKLKGLSYDNSLASSWVAATNDAVSTEEIFTENNTFIYPNPTTSSVNISSTLVIEKYELFDDLGRLVKSESNIHSANFSINLQELSSNTYILKTTSSNQTSQFSKVIKY